VLVPVTAQSLTDASVEMDATLSAEKDDGKHDGRQPSRKADKVEVCHVPHPK
jgi:hypothetical protein